MVTTVSTDQPSGLASADARRPSSAGLLNFWRLVYAERAGLMALFSGVRPGRAGRFRSTNTEFFRYPQELDRAARRTRCLAAGGREVYHCAHLLTAPRRTKSNAAPVLTLWAERDHEPAAGEDGLLAELPPTAVVESSPGRQHLYWRLTRSVDPETAEDLNRRLAASIGADRAGWDLTQLLRPPGTRNFKYPDVPLVRLLSLDGSTRYHPRELDLALPKVHPPAAQAEAPSTALRSAPARGQIDLSRLGGRARGLVLAGNAGAGSPYGSRSEADFAVCLALVSAGYSDAEISAVMADPANGISEKYRSEGRNGPRYLARTIARARPLARGPASPAAA